MQRILLPVDGSQASLRAVDHVVAMARDIGPVEVRLLNVLEPPVVYGEIELYQSREHAEELRTAANQRQLAEAEKKLILAGVPFTSAGIDGNPAKEIAKFAEKEKCAAIVMGTHGMGALGDLLMGSIATKVIHLTHVPVTLVH